MEATWWLCSGVHGHRGQGPHREQRGDISSFVIESCAERGDEGRYTIKVTTPAGEDAGSILLKVVGKHRGPEG